MITSMKSNEIFASKFVKSSIFGYGVYAASKAQHVGDHFVDPKRKGERFELL